MKHFSGRRIGTPARTALFAALILAGGILTGDGLEAARKKSPVSNAPGTPVTITVTEMARHDDGQFPLLAQSDVRVMQGHQSDRVISWVPAQGPQSGMQLLLLLDDSDRTVVATQTATLRQFILQQPPSIEIGVGYMYNGLVQMAQPFTTDRDADVNALHLPMGSVGAASPYFSLMDMYKRGQWQINPQYPRRVILMISDGDDPYDRSAFPQDPYVDEAGADMQRAGIEVFSIYTPGVATRHGGEQGGTYLMQISKGTGGYCLYSGLLGMAVDFEPYLKQFNTLVAHQYLLTVQVHPEGKTALAKVKVTTSAPDVDLLAPEHVPVPGVQD